MTPASRNRPAYIPAFTPVPLKRRADGWTALRQVEFIGRLAETGSVRAAAERVGMARETAYRLRSKPGAEEFARAWDAALAVAGRWSCAPAPQPTSSGRAKSGSFRGQRRATDAPAKVTQEVALERLLAGRWRPVLRCGKFVGCVRKARDSEVLWLLRRGGRASPEELAAAVRAGSPAFSNFAKCRPPRGR